MEARKVRKGMETPLVVYGMRQPYFNQFLVMVALSATGVLYSFVAALHSEPRQWGTALLCLILAIAGLVVAYIVFLSLSQIKRHRFSKEESILSNKDLRKYL